MSLASLPEAIDWARQRWDDRAVPLHLHERGVEPDSLLGAPRLSAAFLRWLMTGVFSVRMGNVSERCTHPRVVHRVTDCPDCMGSGFMEKRREAYFYPMAAALTYLERLPALRPHQPTPYAVVCSVALYGWDWRKAASAHGLPTEMFEALALSSFRKLESRYHVGPDTKVAWTQMSEAQQNATIAGEVA